MALERRDEEQGGRMSQLVVLGFDNEAEARQFGEKIGRMVNERILALDDAAMVVRDMNGKPKVEHGKHLVGAGAMGGAFWGMLFGLLFLMPLAGMALGAAWGALMGKVGDMGVDKQFLQEVGDSIKPGEAGWFLLVREATPDKVEEEIRGTKAKVLRTNMTHEQEERLRNAFSGESA
jgi:uncharacterized membrane protein